MAISTRQIGNAESFSSPDELIKRLREILFDLEDQLNNRAQVYASTDGRVPSGLNRNDILFTVFKGRIGIRVKAAKGYAVLTADMIGGLSQKGTNFMGLTTSAAASALAQYPDTGDWGFHHNTAASTLSLTFNLGGVLKRVTLT